jgi:serine/threonine-protein kinase
MTASTTTPCLDEATLVRVSLGERTEQEFASLEAHLDECSACRRVVAAATSEQTIPAAETYPAIAPGTVIGRYVVEGLLGVGGMGIVYAVRDTALGRPVALKVLRSGNDASSNGRLAREARTMAQLSHPNLVSVFELGEWEGRVYLAMELIDGLSLDGWRKARAPGNGEVLRVLLEAGRGLAAAHAAGVVHRDFKPGNILVGRDGRVWVTDFGLARAPRGEGPTSSSMVETQLGAIMGTPAYMSPEQLAGEPTDARSDQFSFCVTVVEALCGQRPFRASSRDELREAMKRPPLLAGVPRSLRPALQRGLSIERDRRFGSMEALFAALRSAQRRPRIALALALVVGATWGGVKVQRALAPPQVEVVVAAVDIAEGSIITPDMLLQRTMPAQYVTTSVVKPDSATYILGQECLVSIQAGDLLLWQHVSSRRRSTTEQTAPPTTP